MKKYLALIIALSMCLMLLAGCGGSTKASPAEGETEGEEVGETEEAVSTFIEENEIKIQEVSADLELPKIPVLDYFSDENGNAFDKELCVANGAICSPVPGTYSVPTATVSEPDENGYVDYTISYAVDFDAKFEWWDCDYRSVFGDDLYFYSMWKSFDMMDEYTGIVFPGRNMSGDDVYEISAAVEREGETYPVSYSKEMHYKSLDEDWYETNTGYGTTYRGHTDYTYTFHCPEEYDGAVLYINLKGLTEYSEMDYTITEAEEFEPAEGCTIDDYLFIRLSDIVK